MSDLLARLDAFAERGVLSDLDVRFARFIAGAAQDTSPEIVEILNKAVNEALKDPKLVARLAGIGGVPKPMTPADYGRFMSDQTEKWRKVVAFAGVSVD